MNFTTAIYARLKRDYRSIHKGSLYTIASLAVGDADNGAKSLKEICNELFDDEELKDLDDDVDIEEMLYEIFLTTARKMCSEDDTLRKVNGFAPRIWEEVNSEVKKKERFAKKLEQSLSVSSSSLFQDQPPDKKQKKRKSADKDAPRKRVRFSRDTKRK